VLVVYDVRELRSSPAVASAPFHRHADASFLVAPYIRALLSPLSPISDRLDASARKRFTPEAIACTWA
jgi:hypothetical protein